MEQKSYHHGDLKNALIEAGIKIVDTEGMQALSLRKTAAMCNVSHGAPYKHFKDKDDLLLAMQTHITDQFAERLSEAIQNEADSFQNMVLLGCAYLRFFLADPHYFNFVFGRAGVTINLDEWNQDSCPPFDIFRSAATEHFRKRMVPELEHRDLVFAMWSVVHGFTSFATMQTVQYSGDWEALLRKVISKNMLVAE